MQSSLPSSARKRLEKERSLRSSDDAATLTLNADVSWTYQTFTDYLCGNLSAGVGVLNILNVKGIKSSPQPFVVPDCAFDLLQSFSNIQMKYLTLKGDVDNPDPLVRLARATQQPSPISILFFEGGVLLNPDDTRYIVNWHSIFDSMPSLMLFSLSGVFIGETTIPIIPSTLALFDISSCGVIATLPPTLLNQSITEISLWGSIQVSMDHNQIYGSIPPGFFTATGPATDFEVTLSNNNLTSFPDSLFGSKPWPLVTQLQLDFSNNFIASSIPAHFIPPNSFPLATVAYLSLQNNTITGTIPPTMIQDAFASVEQLQLNFYLNKLYGDVPSDLLRLNSTEGGALAPVLTVKLNVQANLLNGTIGSGLFTALNWTKLGELDVYASNNNLHGDLPNYVAGEAGAPSLRFFWFDVTVNPKLTTLPVGFLSSLGNGALHSELAVHLYLGNTGLTGDLVIPGFPDRSAPITIELVAADAQLNTLYIDNNAFDALLSLNVENNPNLTGTIPDSLFGNSSILESFGATGTNLSGTLPDMGMFTAPKLSLLNLGGTAIDVCSLQASNWSTNILTTCRLPKSFSIGGCQSMYPSICQGDYVPTPYESTPYEDEPIVDCKMQTRPGPAWNCISGVWTYEGLYSNLTLTIPSGTTAITINGGLNVSTIIYPGVGAVLTISNGCASNLTSIVIELSSTQLGSVSTKTPYQLLNYPSTCNLTGVSINAHVSGSSCKKVKVQTISSSSSLSGLFSIDSSKCNTWWIVLVSVLCGVILVTAIILVLLILAIPSARAHLLPLKSRSATPAKVRQN